MSLNRREVLAGAAAVAAVSVLPLSLSATPIADSAPLPVAPMLKERGWWGYSTNGGEWFHGPYDSRELALADAQGDYPECRVTTAWCIPEQMRLPHLSEHCIEWMAGATRLGIRELAWWFSGANEDIDYEGEVDDALSSADYRVLTADLRDACATALFRAGRPDLIPAVYDEDRKEPITEDDALLDRLGDDKQFDHDCDEAGGRWLTEQKLDDAPRTLFTRDDQDHPAIEPEVA